MEDHKLSKDQKEALTSHQDLAGELASVRQKLAASKKKLVQLDVPVSLLVNSL